MMDPEAEANALRNPAVAAAVPVLERMVKSFGHAQLVALDLVVHRELQERSAAIRLRRQAPRV